MEVNDYAGINRESWNRKTEAHYNSAFYDVDSFLKGESSLKEIERML